MEHHFAPVEESPLRTLHTLDTSLKRERRVFSIVVSLLVFAAVCAAAITLTSRLGSTLRLEEQAVHASADEVNEVLIQRHNMLTAARLLLELREQGMLAAPPRSATQPLCKPAFTTQQEQPSLRAVCDEAAQLLSAAGTVPPLQFILVDGSAAYGYHLNANGPFAQDAQHIPDEVVPRLVHTVFSRIAARGIDPLAAARERQVLWLLAPAELGFKSALMLGATIVLRDDKPYALVLTSIDPKELARLSILGPLELAPSLIDSDGMVLAGGMPSGDAHAIDQRLSERQDGRFHWLPGYGWGLRLPPLAFDFGHYLLALSWHTQLYVMRNELILVFFTMCSLIALLLAMVRYWNYRFLTRIYSEASRALEGELLNHLLVHATPVGLCIVRRRNLEIVMANQIARNVLGLRDTATRFPDRLCAEFEQRGTQPAAPDGTTNVLQFLFSLECGDDSVHLEITYAPAVLNCEDVLFCAIVDMTAHYEAKQLLREAKLTSDAAARAKVNFFASMSHEIRTPLASLAGNIELVALGPLAPEQEARMQAMQVSAKALLKVVNDVLDFSRMDVDELRLTEECGSPIVLLERVVQTHMPLAVRQALKLYLVTDRGIPSRLLFDPVRVSQIVNNLLSNAFKFTHSGKIVVQARWINEALEINVRDSGVGIDDDLKQRIFQPFTQGEDQRLTHSRGTGLGLSICAQLCELMHGCIALESTVGVGTRIVVTLPLQRCGDSREDANWTLPERRPAILCRAIEYQQWLMNLFDAQTSVPTLLADQREPPQPEQFDYLLVTDEFTPQDVLMAWGTSPNVIWVRQDGPLVPVLHEGGGVEVCIYSLSGIRTATRMLRALPVRPERISQRTNALPPGRNFGQLTVLIVEDNLLNRGLLRDQLRTLGANVIEATHGEEALELLDEERIDIVLTDIDMPVMNGYELLQAVRPKYPSLPVYAVSASARPEDVAQGRAQGFADYLSKPVPLAALAGVLDVAMNPDYTLREETPPEMETPRFPSLPQSYVNAFVEQATGDLVKLQDILKARDVVRIRRWAHGLAGGLSVLGPSTLFETCQELRMQIASSDSWNDEIEALAAAIAEELIEMRKAAQTRVTRHDGSA